MASKVDEFKEFVRRHPLLKTEVESKKKTWQNIYEDYVLLGESNDFFAKYKSEEKIEVKDSAKEPDTASTDKKYSTEEMVKKVLGYVKKINPDTVTKTVTSIQKVMELMGSFGGGATASAVAAKKSTLDPLFDRRFDEWY